MICRFVRSMTAAVFCILFLSSSFAQSNSSRQPSNSDQTEKKPFKILTNGKKITVQSTRNIKTFLAWTSSGNRIIEQQELNTPSYSFDTPTKEKVLFLRIELDNGKIFTEKVGVQ